MKEELETDAIEEVIRIISLHHDASVKLSAIVQKQLDGLIKKIIDLTEKSKSLMIMSTSEICRRYQVQNCSVCDSIDCGDNTGHVIVKIRGLEQKIVLYEKIIKINGMDTPLDKKEI